MAQALEALPDGWVVLHDRPWPGRSKANLDHVVIGPGGVFVVDAKNWSGTIEVRDQVLRQNGRQREQTVTSVAEAAVALQRTLPVSRLCTGVLCFIGDNTLDGWARDVMVCSSANLVTMLLSRPSALDTDEVERCAAAMRRLPAQSSTTSRRSSTSTRKQGRRPIVEIAGAVTFLALLVSGTFTPLAGWVGQQMVEIVSDTQDEPDPAPQDGQNEKRRGKNSTRESRTSR